MKVAISQSNYIPWKGYFDMIGKSDVFVLYDDMQYTKRDWRNRNKIKTPNGLIWLTIPVNVKGNYYQKISETRISEPGWAKKHLRSIELNYKKAACFDSVFPIIESWYNEVENFEFLSEVSHFFLENVCNQFGIQTQLVNSSKYDIKGSKTDALISVLEQIGNVDTYISGPAAKDYMEMDEFAKRNIEVEWMNYGAYPAYRQLHNGFEHRVSIIDLVLNSGFNRDLILQK
ncbi:WbqC family protein [Cryomorpha ignava]|uniref:WbqC family protein n=1 Tax=Cryomorpha ignava TaxID=101383 RepID=A0A7K3WP11_9FLAO|nr:WbqC family protein [Cryomorpha ignava]NEN23403.1 WbqC family protein [Cryomorpha ignava]